MGPLLGGPTPVKYDTDKANIVFHGNSLIYGQSGATVPTGAMPYQVQRLSPVNNQVACTNKGVNGQSWAAMRTTGSQVDALFVEGKSNVLIVWEFNNSIVGEGKTPTQAFADCQAYHADRLSAHPGWLILNMTALPTYYQSWTDTDSANFNAKLDACNTLLRAGWQGMGSKGLVETRQAGSPFLLANYLRTTFAAAKVGGQSVWSPNDQQGGGGTGQNQFVHCSDTGYGVIAQFVASALRRMPRR